MRCGEPIITDNGPWITLALTRNPLYGRPSRLLAAPNMEESRKHPRPRTQWGYSCYRTGIL